MKTAKLMRLSRYSETLQQQHWVYFVKYYKYIIINKIILIPSKNTVFVYRFCFVFLILMQLKKLRIYNFQSQKPFDNYTKLFISSYIFYRITKMGIQLIVMNWEKFTPQTRYFVHSLTNKPKPKQKPKIKIEINLNNIFIEVLVVSFGYFKTPICNSIFVHFNFLCLYFNWFLPYNNNNNNVFFMLSVYKLYRVLIRFTLFYKILPKYTFLFVFIFTYMHTSI